MKRLAKYVAQWGLAAAGWALLAGCAVDPSSGMPTLDVQALGATTLKTLDTPQGPMTLRQTHDAQGKPLFQVKFQNSSQILGFPTGTRLVQFDEAKSIAGATFAIFEATSNTCAHSYTVLIVTARSVLPFKPRTDCHNDLTFFQRDNTFIALQYAPRLHAWSIQADRVDLNPSVLEPTPDAAFLSSVGAPVPPGLAPAPAKAAAPLLPSAYAHPSTQASTATAPRPAAVARPRPTPTARSNAPVANAPAQATPLTAIPMGPAAAANQPSAKPSTAPAPAKAPIVITLGDSP